MIQWLPIPDPFSSFMARSLQKLQSTRGLSRGTHRGTFLGDPGDVRLGDLIEGGHVEVQAAGETCLEMMRDQYGQTLLAWNVKTCTRW